MKILPKNTEKDETELRDFFAITALTLFILCLFFLEGEKKRERESNGDKKFTEFRFIPRKEFKMTHRRYPVFTPIRF